jgi:CubicO group peptidase (beta-lactamase class C family)
VSTPETGAKVATAPPSSASAPAASASAPAASASAPAARAAAAPVTATDSLAARIDDFLTRQSGFGYSGNILLVEHGTVILEKGYGEANRARHVPYDADTVFDIGSLAKQFTAAAILELEVAGRLTVNDALGKFFDVPEDKRAITIQQLLTHASGIASDFPYTDPTLQYEDVGRDEAVRRILNAPLEYTPGTDRQYSNSGYILLAAIVETASGQPFRQYMHRAVFGPAGLTHTGFWAEPGIDSTRVALGYNEYGMPLHDPMRRSADTWQDLGGGQVVSTLGDLRRWQQELAAGHVLPAAVTERLWTAATQDLSPRDGSYGYGWFIKKTPRNTTVIQHGGDYLGTGADLEWYRDEQVLMITSTNVRHDMYPTRNRTDRVVPKILFGGEFPLPPAWKRDDAFLHAALGTYRLPTGGSLVVHERGGRCFIGARGQDATDRLMPAAAEVLDRRARTTAKTQAAMDGLCRGDLAGLRELAGGDKANPAFMDAVTKEIAGLGQGALRKAQVLGTFATGYPRGNPLDYETTLVALEFESGRSLYAIRWANDHIAYTEVPAFELAADTPLQADGNGGLVTWNIVFNLGVKISPRPNPSQLDALVIHSPDGPDVIATREP